MIINDDKQNDTSTEMDDNNCQDERYKNNCITKQN